MVLRKNGVYTGERLAFIVLQENYLLAGSRAETANLPSSGSRADSITCSFVTRQDVRNQLAIYLYGVGKRTRDSKPDRYTRRHTYRKIGAYYAIRTNKTQCLLTMTLVWKFVRVEVYHRSTYRSMGQGSIIQCRAVEG